MNTDKCTDTICLDALSQGLSFTWKDWIKDGKRLLLADMVRIVPILAVWDHRMRSRAQLAKLDAALLDDIGLSEHQARAEYQKPFWVK